MQIYTKNLVLKCICFIRIFNKLAFGLSHDILNRVVMIKIKMLISKCLLLEFFHKFLYKTLK